jgi:hydrogenase large subunit
MAYGDIPDKANDYSPANLLMPRGAIINGKLTEIHPVDLPTRAGAGIRAAQLVQV